MDIVDGLPRSTKGNTGIWVTVDRLTKSAHFIPVKSKRIAPWLGSVYIREIVRLHGVPSSIVSDRDPIFISEFWKSLLREVEIERDWMIRQAPTYNLGSEIKKLRI